MIACCVRCLVLYSVVCRGQGSVQQNVGACNQIGTTRLLRLVVADPSAQSTKYHGRRADAAQAQHRRCIHETNFHRATGARDIWTSS